MTHFSHIVILDQANLRGRPESFTASKDQCSVIMEVFDLIDLKAFTVQYQVELLVNGAYEILGSLNAIVVQPSSISFEPVTTKISEPFHVTLLPSEKRLQDYEELHPENDCDIFKDDKYDLGNLALEYLSLSLPTNPRLPGEMGDYIEFDPQEKVPEASPFAHLSEKLKEE